jgi:hypothetical protein
MPKSLTQEDVEDYLYAHDCVLLSEYKTGKLPITILCKCGHERTSTLSKIKSYNQHNCKKCTLKLNDSYDSYNPYFKTTLYQIHPKTFIKMQKLMERKYEMSKKYRADYFPENYDQQLTCWDCGETKNRKLFPYRKQYKYNKEKRCKQCNNKNNRHRRKMKQLIKK